MRKRYDTQDRDMNPSADFPDYRSNNRRNSIHGVSTVVAFVFLFFLLALYCIACYIASGLPLPLNIADEKANPDAFITERAMHDLQLLTSIGSRGVGFYENEVLAVDFFTREISFIQQQAHSNQKLEVDVQTVSGSYFLNYKPSGFINAYAHVQNVIVKLHSQNNSKHSLLVNAHFDSFPTSPGGSDDGIMCVTMLEILRKLSRSPDQPLHNIIFLFNGAEESPLQASHGFIAHHKWANEIGVVINLEAAGTGYKEFLFQAGPGWAWLLKYYSQVPHPNGHAAGEELFQSNIIPSDTDFRIFRDFGHTIGMDFAFIKNGYRYHTRLDDFANIPPGSYQHVGDNTLNLVRNMANAAELSDPQGQSKDPTIYFDYMGLFFVYYSQSVAILLNITVAIVSTGLAIKSFYDFGLRWSYQSLSYLGWNAAGLILGWVAAGLFVFLTAILLDAFGYSMSWFKNSWIVFGLYIIPVIVCCSGCITFVNRSFNRDNKSKLSVSVQTQIQTHLLRLIWTFPILLGTVMSVRSVYLFLIPLAFQTLTAIIVQIFNLQHTRRLWQVIYILGTIIPNFNNMKAAYDIALFIIPMCGRIGSNRNPEVLIAILSLMLTIFVTSYYIPLVTLLHRPMRFITFLSVIFVLFFIMVFTPLGFPYSSNPEAPAPQRFIIYHTGRTFRNDSNMVVKKDAGFYLLNMDRHSPDLVRNHVKDLNRTKSIKEDCKKSLFCGLPLPSARAIPLLHESTWIPAEQPIIHEPISLIVNSKTSITSTVTRFNLTASGPHSLGIYISPKKGTNLTKTNLVPEMSFESLIWNDRPTYAILYSCGKTNTPLTFSLDIESAANWKGPLIDIAVTGTYKYDKRNLKTPHFLEFLKEFPFWTDVIAWLSVYESWVY